MKIIATENNLVAMDIKVFKLATKLETGITFFYISEVTKFLFILNCNKYIMHLNIFCTRKILKLVY